MAHPWPAWEQMVKPAIIAARAGSASSSTTKADLPPSSRKTFFTVSLPTAMIRRPTGVDPVKVTMSTRGSATRASPTSAAEEVRTFTTPAGISVCSAMIRPMAAVSQGASGGPFSTVVHPAASAGTSFASEIWRG